MKSDDGLEVERDMVDEEMRQGMVNGRMVGMGWTTRRRNRRRRRRVDDVHDLVAAVRSDDGRPVVLLSLFLSVSLSLLQGNKSQSFHFAGNVDTLKSTIQNIIT